MADLTNDRIGLNRDDEYVMLTDRLTGWRRLFYILY